MFRAILATTIALTIFRSAFCGTVITANLPANTAIINVNAKQDGSATYSGPSQDLWYQPFFTGGATGLLQYTVQPGTYKFQLTTPSLAATQFPALTSGQLGQLFTAWTYNSPWATDYMVFNSTATSNPSEPQIFAGSRIPLNHYPGFANATVAYNTAVTEGYDKQIFVAPGGRHTGTIATQITFAAAKTLIFVVPDNVLSDNSGGISVLIQPAVQPVAGDFDSDGDVDGADFVAWQTNFPKPNSAMLAQGDADGDGDVDGADFVVWQTNFPFTPGPAASPLPEPGAYLLALGGFLALVVFSRRRSRPSPRVRPRRSNAGAVL